MSGKAGPGQAASVNCGCLLGTAVTPGLNRTATRFTRRCISRQHRIIWQENWASHFAPNESLEIAGILDVFQNFQTAQLGQKGRPGPQTQLCGVASTFSQKRGWFSLHSAKQSNYIFLMIIPMDVLCVNFLIGMDAYIKFPEMN